MRVHARARTHTHTRTGAPRGGQVNRVLDIDGTTPLRVPRVAAPIGGPDGDGDDSCAEALSPHS